MGVKWTCTFLCLLGIAFLSIEASSSAHKTSRIRDRRASGYSASARTKRDVKRVSGDDGNGGHYETVSSSDNGGQSFSTSSTWSDKNRGGGSSSAHASASSSSSSGGFQPGVGSRSGFAHSGDDGEQFSYGSGFNFPHAYERGHDWSFAGDMGQGFAQGQSWASGGFPGGYNAYRNYGPSNVRSYPYYPSQNSVFNEPPNFNFREFQQNHYGQWQNQQNRNRGPHQPWVKNGMKTWAHAAAFMTGLNGGVQPNARAITYSRSSTSRGSTADYNQGGASRTGQGRTAPVNNGQRFAGQNNRLGYGSPYNNYYPNQFDFGTRGGFVNDFGNFDRFNQGFPYSSSNSFSNSGGPPFHGHEAFGQAQFGTRGGFQKGHINPAVDGVESRFSEDLPPPPPGASSFGTSSRSKTSSYVGPDGKEHVVGEVTTTVNNNGKVTSKTIRYP